MYMYMYMHATVIMPSCSHLMSPVVQLVRL